MKPLLRSAAGVVAGMATGGLLALVVERIGHAVYLPPPGLDPENAEQVRRAMAEAPAGALLFVLAAWIVAAFSGAWVAARLAGRNLLLHRLLVGALFLSRGSSRSPRYPTRSGST
jgi:hypothetical protein